MSKVMLEVDIIRCSATRPNGESCMTLFPAMTAKAEMYCKWCYEEQARLKERKQKLREAVDRLYVKNP